MMVGKGASFEFASVMQRFVDNTFLFSNIMAHVSLNPPIKPHFKNV